MGARLRQIWVAGIWMPWMIGIQGFMFLFPAKWKPIVIIWMIFMISMIILTVLERNAMVGNYFKLTDTILIFLWLALLWITAYIYKPLRPQNPENWSILRDRMQRADE